MRRNRFVPWEVLALLLSAVPAAAQAPQPTPAPTTTSAAAAAKAEVPVETFTLDNGMKFLLVRKPEATTVSAGWVGHVGSANERPGITGLAHLFEHMLFKGTTTIGTKNIKRDLEIIAEQEQIQEQIREIYRQQRQKARLGEIEDPFGPGQKPPELVDLEKKFQKLVDEQRALMVKDEFDKIYTENGASGMNAFTNNDMTVFFVTVPANKAELWFWMESDRLKNPVLREFYSERDVVHEERRLRTESTPTGKFDEQLNAMFWESHPYSWPVVGWPSDLRVISKQEADQFFATYYAPNNLTAAVVGNFDPAQIKQLAQKYFGRLERHPTPPDVVTLEMPQLAEKRMIAHCDCQPQMQVMYHTVSFESRDAYALDVLAGILNGRTGRLYKNLVLDQQIASTVGAAQNDMKYAGYFSVSAEAKGDASPEQLEQSWYAQLKRMQDEPVPAEELQKVKNQISADAFRRLENPFFLMIQLLYYDGLGDWSYLNDWSQNTLAVSAEDVQRVAKQYFAPENRTVGLYYRQAGASAEQFPPEVAQLPAEVQGPVKQQIRQLRQIQDVDQLQQIAGKIAEQRAQAPAPMQKVMDVLAGVVQQRIEELSKAGTAGKQKGDAQ